VTSSSMTNANAISPSIQQQQHLQQQYQQQQQQSLQHHQQQLQHHQQLQHQQSVAAVAAAAIQAQTNSIGQIQAQVGATANSVGAIAAAAGASQVTNVSEHEEQWTYDPNEPRYCICNQVSYGDMVACDNQEVSKL